MSADLREKYVEEILAGETYTIKDVAERLHVSVWSVRSYVRDGKLGAHKRGREYIVPKSALRDFILGTTTAPDSQTAEPIESEPEPEPKPKPVERAPEPVVDFGEVDEEEEEAPEPPRPQMFGYNGF